MLALAYFLIDSYIFSILLGYFEIKAVNCFIFQDIVVGAERKKLKRRQRPYFGKVAKFTGSVDSLDGKWHVDFYDVSYFFMGVEIFSVTKETVVSNHH